MCVQNVLWLAKAVGYDPMVYAGYELVGAGLGVLNFLLGAEGSTPAGAFSICTVHESTGEAGKAAGSIGFGAITSADP
ncbi:hypothetical protein Dimus_022138 [Dionaea muscipula]